MSCGWGQMGGVYIGVGGERDAALEDRCSNQLHMLAINRNYYDATMISTTILRSCRWFLKIWKLCIEARGENW
ncbi:hypothetical protein PanWU01x14_360630 [Parasponia andersonii]|uniref:Uncharacterized protein n=1 Tax=Parasponia andersonii TaxID=3476 RepID=A0A2P5A7N4_PARAD|nr:hypothetical protein PanWU01x14_360630 [Parasponia andersonii]